MSVVKLEVKIISVDSQNYETHDVFHTKSEFITLQELVQLASGNENAEPLESKLNTLVHELLKEL